MHRLFLLERVDLADKIGLGEKWLKIQLIIDNNLIWFQPGVGSLSISFFQGRRAESDVGRKTRVIVLPIVARLIHVHNVHYGIGGMHTIAAPFPFSTERKVKQSDPVPFPHFSLIFKT